MEQQQKKLDLRSAENTSIEKRNNEKNIWYHQGWSLKENKRMSAEKISELITKKSSDQ